MIRALVVDRRLQRSAGCVHPRFGGPDRDLKQRRDLRQGSTFEVMKDQDRPLVDFEAAHRRAEDPCVAIDSRCPLAIDLGPEVRSRDFAHTATTTRTMRHPCRVGGHALEPGLEAIRIPKATDLSPGSDERLLGGVGRVSLVAEDREGQSVHSIHPDTHDLLERVEVTVASPFHERSVGRG
jgi:hypothetical protein